MSQTPPAAQTDNFQAQAEGPSALAYVRIHTADKDADVSRVHSIIQSVQSRLRHSRSLIISDKTEDHIQEISLRVVLAAADVKQLNKYGASVFDKNKQEVQVEYSGQGSDKDRYIKRQAAADADMKQQIDEALNGDGGDIENPNAFVPPEIDLFMLGDNAGNYHAPTAEEEEAAEAEASLDRAYG